MNDFEKNRAEYVLHLEALVKNLQQQLLDIKSKEQWIPHVSASTDPKTNNARVTLAFNGKQVGVSLTAVALQSNSVADVTSAVIDSYIENLIRDQFREVVEPEVRRLVEGSRAVVSAGKW